MLCDRFSGHPYCAAQPSIAASYGAALAPQIALGVVHGHLSPAPAFLRDQNPVNRGHSLNLRLKREKESSGVAAAFGLARIALLLALHLFRDAQQLTQRFRLADEVGEPLANLFGRRDLRQRR
ncbi:MAG: hypothetical protein DCC68_11490 [Planctomycetota bacterium]|nr:MAG: hypothetical protein DCC68_11490 [Planctomycetota bacterium]